MPPTLAIGRDPATPGAPRPTPTYSAWIDVLLVLALGALIGGVTAFARRWHAPLRPSVEIDLSAWALPGYTALSLGRGIAAYILSLLFTLVYGTIAAHNRRAERVMIPVIDILQGIPVLGFLPGLVLGLVALFPHSNVGLELASVVMIFTGQVWNMTFSFYGSLRGIPTDFRDVARINGFGWWKTFRTLELPSSTIGLLWNSMMSMAGGWFFLTVTEAFTLGDRDFRLPGIGSYMAVAIDQGDRRAMAYAVVAMIVMIVTVDQLVWRPALVWAQKFKVEETAAAEAPRSFVLDLLRRSRIPGWFRHQAGRLFRVTARQQELRGTADAEATRRLLVRLAGWTVAGGALLFAAWGAVHLVRLVIKLRWRDWLKLAGALGLTFSRTTAAIALGALWAVPVGVWIGISPRRSRLLQQPIQVAASFPAPMLYPLVTMALLAAHIPFSWGCVALMLLGAQWYILFNVLAGASAMPQDLREAADFALLAAGVLTMSFALVVLNRTVWRRLYRVADERFSLNR